MTNFKQTSFPIPENLDTPIHYKGNLIDANYLYWSNNLIQMLLR